MNWDKAVFLAHASEDKPIVRDLYSHFKSAGLDPWMDEKNLPPGVKWDSVIKEAIKKARFFVACISSRSISKSGYVQKELRVALAELEKKAPNVIYFIPALIEDVPLPDITVGTISLTEYQSAKIFEAGELEKLTDHLKRHADIVDEIKSKENPKFGVVRAALAKGMLEDAMQLLLKIVPQDSDLRNTVIMLSARYHRYNMSYTQGMITMETYSVQNSQITYALLDLIRIIESG